MPSFVPETPFLLAYLAAVLVIVFTPGPDMTLFLGKTLTQGRSRGFAAMLGATSGLLVHTMFAAIGLSALLAASETAYRAVQIAGAVYLLWLAVQALRHGSALTLGHEKRRAEPIISVFLQGLGINLLNPKIVLFFVTFLPQFVAPGDPSAAGKLIFLGLTLVFFGLTLCAVMIVFADRISGALRRSPAATKAMDWLFASIMGGFAVKLLLERR